MSGRGAISWPLLRFAVLATAVAATVSFLGPWPLDPTDPAETGWGRGSIRAARELGAELGRAREAPFRAGFGRAEITPPTGVTLAGYSARNDVPATGVADPLFARAVALAPEGQAPIVIVGADVLIVSEAIAARVRAELAREGVPADRILFTATHTHSGPGGWGESIAERITAGTPHAEARRRLEEGMVAAAREAVLSLEPASAGVGRARVPAFVKNRYWEAGERPDDPPDVDDELSFLKVRGKGGRDGYVVSYGAHGTIVPPEPPHLVSGDYPGALARALESDAGVAVALFAAGAVGSQAPNPPAAESPYAAADRMGEALAAEVRRTSTTKVVASDGLAIAAGSAPLRLPPRQLRIARDLRASPILMATQIDREAAIGAVRVGRDLLLGIPGEISGEIGVRLKAEAARRGLRLWLFPFHGEYAGYVLPDEYYPRLRYENRMSFFGPHFGSYLAACCGAVVEGMAGSGQGP